MKARTSIFSAAALIVFAALSVSCEKYNSGDRTIGFSVDKVVPTKSSPITTSNLKTSYGKFYSEAYLNGQSGADALYYGRSVTSWDSAESVWGTGQFWPEETATVLDFWSYGPVGQFEETSVSSDHSSFIFEYSPVHDPVARTDAADQQDIIVAYTGGQKWVNNKKVPVSFNHQLAAVRFKIGDISSFGTTSLRIGGITLKNLIAGGQCTVNNSANGTWNTAGFPTGSYTQIFPADSPALTSGMFVDSFSTDETILGDEIFMLVPQTISNDASILLNWSLDGVQYTSREVPFSKNNVSLEAGKIYTFTINVMKRDGAIELAVVLTSVIPWNDVLSTIDYSHTVTGQQQLEFSNCAVDAGRHLVTFDGARPVIGRFLLSEPLGSTVLVRLKGDFDAFRVSYNGGRNIDGATQSEFSILPLLPNPERDYVITLQISVAAADGRVINVDDIVQGTDRDQYYTIVYPKAL